MSEVLSLREMITRARVAGVDTIRTGSDLELRLAALQAAHRMFLRYHGGRASGEKELRYWLWACGELPRWVEAHPEVLPESPADFRTAFIREVATCHLVIETVVPKLLDGKGLATELGVALQRGVPKLFLAAADTLLMKERAVLLREIEADLAQAR